MLVKRRSKLSLGQVIVRQYLVKDHYNRGLTSPSSLAKRLHVSQNTVEKDLKELRKKGMLADFEATAKRARQKVRELRKQGLSIRSISAQTGLGRGMVQRALPKLSKGKKRKSGSKKYLTVADEKMAHKLNDLYDYTVRDRLSRTDAASLLGMKPKSLSPLIRTLKQSVGEETQKRIDLAQGFRRKNVPILTSAQEKYRAQQLVPLLKQYALAVGTKMRLSRDLKEELDARIELNSYYMASKSQNLQILNEQKLSRLKRYSYLSVEGEAKILLRERLQQELAISSSQAARPQSMIKLSQAGGDVKAECKKRGWNFKEIRENLEALQRARNHISFEVSGINGRKI